MHINYDDIAPGYDQHRRGAGPYFETLLAQLAQTPPGPLLELGAGTGNETREVIAATQRRIVALERSAGMLAELRSKQLAAHPVQGDARLLPFMKHSFAGVFGAYMLHYIHDLPAFFRECRRVLIPRGVCAVVTVPETFIASHPMNEFFPSFARVDLARFQPVGEVQSAMSSAGFTRIAAHHDVGPHRAVDAAYLVRIESRFISTYDLLPPEEFAAGVAALRACIARPGGSGISIAREATTIAGWNECA